MSVQVIEQIPMEHFEWILQRYPNSAPIELMKLAFNTGLTTAIDKFHPTGDSRTWLSQQMLDLDIDKMDPPLTPEQWRRGP